MDLPEPDARPAAGDVRRLLDRLLREAGLPPSVSTVEPTGRTFGRHVHIARLADGRRVVLRRWIHRAGPRSFAPDSSRGIAYRRPRCSPRRPTRRCTPSPTASCWAT